MNKKSNQKIIITVVALVVLIAGALIAKPMLANNSGSEHKTIAKASMTEVKQLSSNQDVTADSISKNETVYAKLNADGTVKDTTVVNWFHFSKDVPAQLTDPVQLKQAKALNGSFTVKSNADGISLSNLETGKKDIFYSGQTGKTLPIKTSFKYYLDGKQINPKELPGKTGDVKIVIDLSNQMKSMENISYGSGATAGSSKKEIYTPLVTMVSMELPIETFSDVQASDGLVTVVGETMKVNWMLFPYPDAQAVLTMHAQDFRLGSAQMVVQPMMPPLSDYEGQKNKLEELNNGLTEMDKAMQQVESGSQQLADSQTKIKDGLTTVQQGTAKLILLNQAEEKMAAGALQICNGVLQAVQPYADNPTAGNMVKPLIAALQKQQEVLKTMVEGGTINEQKVPPMSTTSSSLQMAQTALGKLAEGSEKSSAGARQMHDAVGQIRTQGISKMQSGVSGTLQELNVGLGQIKIMQNKVDHFDTFIGKDPNVQGSVQFIIQTEELE